MEEHEFRKNALDMIYLTTCALGGTIPDQKRVASLDLPQLFEVCQAHILTACVAYALEAGGISDHAFTQAKEKAIRKNILFDTERRKLLRRLEEEHIWYMPLKGALLKDQYPRLGMRQMSDNDILCDAAHRERIKAIMLEEGFDLKLSRRNVDEFEKPPVYNFEMHACLVSETTGVEAKFYKYYKNVKKRLIKDDDNGYGYHFRPEDFYLYMLAHEYKHYYTGGTGVRSLVDSYVFLRKHETVLDWTYINAELAKLGIEDYEAKSRTLAMKLFRGELLAEKESKELDYYILSGTYGNSENLYANRFDREAGGSKLHYLLFRLFPPYDYLAVSVPWVKKSKLLMPAAYIYRIVHGAGKKNAREELRFLKQK